jgi:hypothetical protein
MSRISVIVKQSCTSAQSMRSGPSPDIAYARSAAMTVAFMPVKLAFSCRYGWSVATPNPATYTGLSVNSCARSAFTRIVAAAPSVCGQQSRRCSGWHTGGDLSASSIVISFWKCAYGSRAPL